jgi:hypothetical protein
MEDGESSADYENALKQKYLKKEIIDKGLDPEEFISFLENRREDGKKIC